MPTFSRRGYSMVAGLLLVAYRSGHADMDLILSFAEMFREDNPRFETTTFIRACRGLVD